MSSSDLLPLVAELGPGETLVQVDSPPGAGAEEVLPGLPLQLPPAQIPQVISRYGSGSAPIVE